MMSSSPASLRREQLGAAGSATNGSTSTVALTPILHNDNASHGIGMNQTVGNATSGVDDSAVTLHWLCNTFAALQVQLKQYQSQLEAREAQLQGREAALEREKQMMMSEKVSPEDRVHLNVQGEDVVVRRSILCLVEGTLLAAMFSGRWEENLTRDNQGRVHLDCDPNCFRKLVSYLTRKSMETSDNPAKPPIIPQDMQPDFEHMLEWLCFDVHDVMHVTKPNTPLALSGLHYTQNFVAKGSATSEVVGRNVVVSVPWDFHRYASFNLGYPPESKAVVWQCTIDSLAGNDQFLLGISGDHQLDDRSFEDELTYGWVTYPRAGDRKCVAGQRTPLPAGRHAFGSPLVKGDVILFKLDLVKRQLKSYLVRTKVIKMLQLEHDHRSWCAHINLLTSDTRIMFGAADPALVMEAFGADN